MAHQTMLIDDDYTVLQAAASRTGDSVEALAHQAIAEYVAQAQRSPQIGTWQYPTGEPDSPEDEAEDEELAAAVGAEKP